ncbi:uncharacterized protein LOC135813010 [Sycon ciliatum]|uniref:uncharacterized protein LOC135813010 n=1 Tax=Sycon ciliatum TaxID=27933 RepID=UPI0031F71A5B
MEEYQLKPSAHRQMCQCACSCGQGTWQSQLRFAAPHCTAGAEVCEDDSWSQAVLDRMLPATSHRAVCRKHVYPAKSSSVERNFMPKHLDISSRSPTNGCVESYGTSCMGRWVPEPLAQSTPPLPTPPPILQQASTTPIYSFPLGKSKGSSHDLNSHSPIGISTHHFALPSLQIRTGSVNDEVDVRKVAELPPPRSPSPPPFPPGYPTANIVTPYQVSFLVDPSTLPPPRASMLEPDTLIHEFGDVPALASLREHPSTCIPVIGNAQVIYAPPSTVSARSKESAVDSTVVYMSASELYDESEQVAPRVSALNAASETPSAETSPSNDGSSAKSQQTTSKGKSESRRRTHNLAVAASIIMLLLTSLCIAAAVMVIYFRTSAQPAPGTSPMTSFTSIVTPTSDVRVNQRTSDATGMHGFASTLGVTVDPERNCSIMEVTCDNETETLNLVDCICDCLDGWTRSTNGDCIRCIEAGCSGNATCDIVLRDAGSSQPNVTCQAIFFLDVFIPKTSKKKIAMCVFTTI